MVAYKEKFLDPRWQKKRLEILARDEFCCQMCFDPESTLHVHHRYYETAKDPWDYPDNALVTLCDECHECEHEAMKSALGWLEKLLRTKFLSGDIINIHNAFGGNKLTRFPEVCASMIEWAFCDEDTCDYIQEKYWERNILG